MYVELYNKCPEEFVESKSIINRLVKMQHYGLPTRLLDITRNPLVALYFAVRSQENDNRYGEVIVFDVDQKNIKTEFDIKLKSLDDIKKKEGNNPELLNLALSNKRIQRQQGLFFLIYNEKTEEEYLNKLRYEENEKKIVFLFKKNKESIRKQLDMLGFNEAELFPEIEHMAEYIKWRYE